jgi:cell division protein FtsN
LPKVEGKTSVDTFEVKRPELVSKPKAPEIVKPSVGKNYVIQVASFQDRKLAETFASNLRKKGYNAFVEKAFVEWKGGNWYRVRIGFFDSIEQAKKTAEKLKRTEKVEKVWVSEAPRTVTK